MKEIFYLLLFSIVFLVKTNAQVYSNFGQSNQHYTFDAFDKFVGKWKYVNGLDTFYIELKKVVDTFSIRNYTSEGLIGYQRYVKNDTIYDDSFGLINQGKSKATMRLSTNAKTPYDPNFLKGTVLNHGTDRIRYLQLEYLSNGNIKWTTWAHVTPVRYNSPVPSYAHALPSEVVLIKQ